jgi:hypothetical protein
LIITSTLHPLHLDIPILPFPFSLGRKKRTQSISPF